MAQTPESTGESPLPGSGEPRPEPPPPAAARGRLLAWALVLILALAPRLHNLDAPPLDANHVRQSDTASIARIMAREGIDLLHPRIDWAGPEAGTVESELPLYAAAVAAGWSLRGGPERPSWAWPRGLSLLAWLAGALALAAWVRRRLPDSPLHYLWLYALSPLGVVFSRNVQPDALAIALFLWGCELADAMSERPGLRGLSGALFGGSLAGLEVASKDQLAFLLPQIGRAHV